MSEDTTQPGRLRGGLSRIRRKVADRAHLIAFMRRHSGRASKVGWALAQAVVGGLVGMLFASLYLKYR